MIRPSLTFIAIVRATVPPTSSPPVMMPFRQRTARAASTLRRPTLNTPLPSPFSPGRRQLRAPDQPNRAALLLGAELVGGAKEQRDAGVGEHRRPLPRALLIERRLRQHEMQHARDPRFRLPQADRNAAPEGHRRDHVVSPIGNDELADADAKNA